MGKSYLAVDQGILVKTRQGCHGISTQVQSADTISKNFTNQSKREFLQIDQQERTVREMLAKMESGFIHRLKELQNE